MSIPDSVKSVCDSLRQAFDQTWDADDGMEDAYVRQSPLGRLVEAFETRGATEALKYLTYSAAQRALPCWELYCDNTQPQEALDAAKWWLQSGMRPTNVSTLAVAARPAYRGCVIHDCRSCDTGCASSAAAQLIRFLDTSNTLHAIYCLSATDAAFDQSPLESLFGTSAHGARMFVKVGLRACPALGSKDFFRKWLFDHAIPLSFERRILADLEQNALREYDAGEIPQIREREASYWNGRSCS